jgi:hypothetical protein
MFSDNRPAADRIAAGGRHPKMLWLQANGAGSSDFDLGQSAVIFGDVT